MAWACGCRDKSVCTVRGCPHGEAVRQKIAKEQIEATNRLAASNNNLARAIRQEQPQ